MNLHGIVGPLVGGINRNLQVQIQVSTGTTEAADGTLQPTFADPVTVTAQIQPVTYRDLQQLEGLNLQGTRKALYINGCVEGLVRVTNQGGDLVTLPDGSIWLVAMVLEDFGMTAGWTKAAITLQNGG